jgi:ethanolamine utilization protein EutQ (cupin superfamily)
MGKQQANYRLDESLLEALKDRANSEGVSTTDIVTKALQQYLGAVYQVDIQTAIQPDLDLDERIAVLLDERIAVLKHELTANLQDAIANIKTSETTASKKSKPLASIAA